jgi:hypothetical protein
LAGALSEAGGPTSGFVLHDAEGEGKFGYPTSMDDSRFDRQLRKLVEAIARTLDAFPRNAQTAPSAKIQTSGISLFLADVPDTLRLFRKRLIAEIGDKARILDALPPPYPSAEHNRRLEAILQQEPGDGVPVSYLIDTHQKNQRYAFKLADLLRQLLDAGQEGAYP